MSRTPWLLSAVVLLALGFQGVAIMTFSLTNDEPVHLLAGYQAWKIGTHAINLEHPPLPKLIAATPLLLESHVFTLPSRAESAARSALEIFENPIVAERITVRARLALMLIFALPLLVGTFFLGREVGGDSTGLVLVSAMAFSFSTLPYLSLITTDAAVAAATTFGILAAIRWLRKGGLLPPMGLGLALGFGLVSKFSAVFLLPVYLVAAALFLRRRDAKRRWLSLLLPPAVAAFVFFGVFLLANWNYDREMGRAGIRTYCTSGGGPNTGEVLRPWEASLLRLEEISPALAQWATGFASLAAQERVGAAPSYAFGTVSSFGRWWYFPALLFFRAPLPLLLASLLALYGAFRSRDSVRTWITQPAAALVFVFGIPFFLVACGSVLNWGIRHLLPLLPLLALPAAVWAGRSRRRSMLLIFALIVEAAVICPGWMEATHTWWLGSKNPTRFAFATSNGEYRQNLKRLQREVEARNLSPLFVVFPGTDPAWIKAYVPTAQVLAPGDPTPPGWYAVSIVAEQYLPAFENADEDALLAASQWKALALDYAAIRRSLEQAEDHGYFAGTFHLLRLLNPEQQSPLPSQSRVKETP